MRDERACRNSLFRACLAVLARPMPPCSSENASRALCNFVQSGVTSLPVHSVEKWQSLCRSFVCLSRLLSAVCDICHGCLPSGGSVYSCVAPVTVVLDQDCAWMSRVCEIDQSAPFETLPQQSYRREERERVREGGEDGRGEERRTTSKGTKKRIHQDTN